MNNQHISLLLGAGLLLAGCARSTNEPSANVAPADAAKPGATPPATQSQAAAPKSDAPAPAPVTQAARPVERIDPIVVPAGTRIAVRTTSTLSTKTNQTGETFTGTLTQPLMAGNKVIAPQGAEVQGRITSATSGGKVKGLASIGVQLTSLSLMGGRNADISTGTYVQQAKTSKKKDALKVGIGSGIGAAIGAIAGGGKGAAIGAGAGAGAGTGAVLLTKGDAAVIPSESVITFRLSEPLTVKN